MAETEEAPLAKDAAFWRLVEIDYRDSKLTLVQIAEKYGLTKSALSYYRKKFGWPARQKKRLGHKNITTKSKVKLKEKQKPTHAEVMIEQVWVKLASQLEEMNTFNPDEPQIYSAAERERDARTLSSITRTLERLAALKIILSKQDQEKEKSSIERRDPQEIQAELERQLDKLIDAGEESQVSRESYARTDRVSDP